MSGVLVTGATTPIGERLVRSLLADTAIDHVLAVSNRPPEAALPFSQGDRLVYCSVDLSRTRPVRELLFGVARDLAITTVIHLSMHRSTAAHGAKVHALNVDALRSLLQLCERHPTIERLVLKSWAEVYQVQHDLPTLVTEDHPLNMGSGAPQWIRDRVEADTTAATRMGMSKLEIMVLRCAEVLAPGTGSQLFDYLQSPICLRPAGFDPMMNLLSMQDVIVALELAARARGVQGILNIPGADTLPLSQCVARFGKSDIPLPSSLITPVYRLRRHLRGADFSYGMNRRRFHYASVLDGTRAKEALGYEPAHTIEWPYESPDPVS